MMTRRLILTVLLLLFLIPFLMAVDTDTMTCYTLEYITEPDPYFKVNDGIDGLSALIGTLKLYVNPEDPNRFHGSDDQSTYIRTLYFRQSDLNEEVNKAVMTATISGTQQYIEAHLVAKTIPANGSSVPGQFVDLYEQTIDVYGGDAPEQYLHILPAYYRVTEPKETNSAGQNVHQVMFRNGIDVCTVEFYLKLIPNANVTLDQLNTLKPSLTMVSEYSEFSSIDTVCLNHNWNPIQFKGSLVAGTRKSGDLSYFPSEHYNKPINVGAGSENLTVNAWVTFLTENTSLTPADFSSGSIKLGTISALIYGSALTEDHYSVEIKVRDAFGTQSSNDFRLKRIRTGSNDYDDSAWFDYNLWISMAENQLNESGALSGVTRIKDINPIAVGTAYEWKNLKAGLAQSKGNTATLYADNFRYNSSDGSQVLKPGLYSDTVTIEITSIN